MADFAILAVTSLARRMTRRSHLAFRVTFLFQTKAEAVADCGGGGVGEGELKALQQLLHDKETELRQRDRSSLEMGVIGRWDTSRLKQLSYGCAVPSWS